MISSDIHRYVYVGIPRTGTKSMNHWLCEHFDGRWCEDHHSCDVPQELRDYLVFTLVRNPYDRAVSGHFAVTWGDQAPKNHELEPYSSEQERLRKSRAFLKARERQYQKDMPQQSSIPLEERMRAAKLENESEDANVINQKRFVDRAGVKMVLYFERIPQCLAELPFVDASNVPPFPHHPEKGIRPQGNFFDFFHDSDEEQVVWAHAAEDFYAFGYRRLDCGLPEDSPNALRIT